MKYSVFSVGTPEYDIPKTIGILKELGYDGVEWRVANPPPITKPDSYTFQNRYWSYNLSTLDVDKIDETAVELKNLCDLAGLEVCSLTTYLGPSKTEDIERVSKAANIIGCKNIRVSLPKYDETLNYKEIFDKSLNEVRAIETFAAKYGVRINFEIHMGNIIPSASAAYRFVSNFNPKHVGVIFDPGNMVYEGYENYKLGIDLLGEYLSYVHIKNASWKLEKTAEDGVEIWKPSNAPLKKGYADMAKLINVLKEKGYEGYLSVEDFSNEEDTYTKLKNNLEYLKKLASA